MCQLGPHPPAAIGLARGGVHRGDQVGQVGVPDRTGRGCTPSRLVVARPRDTQRAAGASDRVHRHRRALRPAETALLGAPPPSPRSRPCAGSSPRARGQQYAVVQRPTFRSPRLLASVTSRGRSDPDFPPIQTGLGDPERRGDITDSRPDSTRSRARRRNSAGHGLGTMHRLLRCSPSPATPHQRVRRTGGTSGNRLSGRWRQCPGRMVGGQCGRPARVATPIAWRHSWTHRPSALQRCVPSPPSA